MLFIFFATLSLSLVEVCQISVISFYSFSVSFYFYVECLNFASPIKDLTAFASGIVADEDLLTPRELLLRGPPFY